MNTSEETIFNPPLIRYRINCVRSGIFILETIRIFSKTVQSTMVDNRLVQNIPCYNMEVDKIAFAKYYSGNLEDTLSSTIEEAFSVVRKKIQEEIEEKKEEAITIRAEIAAACRELDALSEFEQMQKETKRRQNEVK